MEEKRIQFTRDTKLEISRLEKIQKREKETLNNLKNLNLEKEIYEKHYKDIEEKIQKRDLQLSELEIKVKKYLSGELDNEILDIYKPVENIKKNAVQKKPPKPVEDFKKNGYKQNLEKDFKYYYTQFKKSEETLPSYMRDNLKDMPNNKGYIWRGCMFFGLKKREKGQPEIFFEKMFGNIMRIHEFVNDKRYIYEKIGSDRKKLVKII